MGRRLSKKTLKLIISLLIILAGAVAAGSRSSDRGANLISQNQPGLYRVEEVSDGDTFIVDMNGTREIIRMIGVDTPETHHPDRPVQCYGREASEYLRKLLVDKKVRLEADPLNTNRDRYERLLRYVYLPDGTLVNGKIVEEGYGFSYTPFPFSKTDIFDQYEQDAKQNKRGLWNACSVQIEENGTEHTNPSS